jgi:class 3 adenylate cyclase
MTPEKPMERRLAAILSLDVAGYSRLMDADEAGTHAALSAHRKELVEPQIARFHGRVVKLTGDGALVEFASAVDAVHCACAIQQGMAERNEGIPDERKILFRIGVNTGDVISEEGDIYGTGVNVAARLQELAEAGGILVSESVAEYVRSLADLSFEYVGERHVKNIAAPVSVYRIEPRPSGRVAHRMRRRGRGLSRGAWSTAAVAVLILVAGMVAAWFYWQQRTVAPTLPAVPSVAVLPFDDFSAEPGQDYLANGITEDLITDLAKVPDFFVVARNSCFDY